MGEGEVGGQQAGCGAASHAVFGPRAVALAGERSRRRGRFVAVLTPGERGGKTQKEESEMKGKALKNCSPRSD